MHIMLDLETLSTENDAFIISIGAVYFNKDGIHESFFETVELPDHTRLHLSPKTVGWWLGQPNDAKKHLQVNPVPLSLVLVKFIEFCQRHGKVTGMWGNGSTFDNVILRNAFKSENISAPWHFRYDYCYRSIKYLLPEIKFERYGIHHHPLDDAKSQALHMIKICNIANINLGES